MNRTGKILIGAAVAVFVLLIILGSVYFVTGGGDSEDLVFYEAQNIPEDAVIIHLTEEDYEKYPVLKEIPKKVDIDKSIFAPYLTGFDLLDKETAYEIYETYGRGWGKSDEKFIKHEGTIYWIGIAVS